MPWALIALRWALYADLGLVFGAPMAAMATRNLSLIAGGRRELAAASLIGIAVSLVVFCLTVANMAGVQLADLDRSLALSLLTGSALGWALMVRCAALAFLAGLTMSGPARNPRLLIVFGAIAVTTLAWLGHAAASQGAAGWLRLAGDAVHLLAGLTWFGGLVVFAVWLWLASRGAARPLEPAIEALSRFAFAGSVIVALLMASGAANLLFLVSPKDVPRLAHTLYGTLLAAKLVLFALMLGLASLNRFRLVPAVQHLPNDPLSRRSVLRLRLSVFLELATAVAVLGLVAWLGTLDPLGATA